MYLYLQLLIVFAVIPSLILLYMNRDNIRKKVLLVSLFLLFCLGVIWDQLSIRFGIWTFADQEVIGYFLGMPIEEYLFMIFVPLLVITMYLQIEKFSTSKESSD